MKSLAAVFLTMAISTAALSPAEAGISPYLHVAFSGNQLKMTDINANIMSDQAAVRAAGYPADFQRVGLAGGPSAAAGLWLGPLRVGATYSYQHAFRENRVHVPGQFFYDDQLRFRITEIGGEAALRVVRFAGLSVGGEFSQARAEFVEGFSVEQIGSQYYLDGSGHRTKNTYGAFIGLDQTNSSGIAGFVRVGYHFRNIGPMPAGGTVSDGTTTTPFTGTTSPMDYSGFYFSVGTGFDFRR